MNLLLVCGVCQPCLAVLRGIFAPVANSSCFYVRLLATTLLELSSDQLLPYRNVDLIFMFCGSFQIHREMNAYLGRFFNQV